MKNVIVIPIYKVRLTEYEITSLKQCFKILGKHPIKFVAPNNLDLSVYNNVLEKPIEVEYFNSHFFKNISGYNQLMLSKEFYERFSHYNYMLVYQLDCYVFRDELDFWCLKGYDYIGAPWLDYRFYSMRKTEKLKFLIKRLANNKVLGKKYVNKDTLVYNVGNGGFSLRKISKFLETLRFTSKDIIEDFSKSNEPSEIKNEDIFWSFEAKNIKKPNYKIAAKFSLEQHPFLGMRLNSNQLPFGCHAWDKKYSFWKDYIDLAQ
ncbi:hypothetical protein IQ37_00325 [Chryseobacterium piperi]|uniref:DUF5672 domain-containing protein n=1 Tax=Chryseobacterium piperi TaxID=558152 RepID=A0A086BMU9_9FLAO|nr:DUF5672 family protein [Chryseobacterium piperi]ASW75057.1 hypothetical protein CJF12_12730 [Chryseobacterium piperi]KFF30263.1 hypothetical protein IQ37_00325 [Chryseobacterium piperi]